MGLTATTKRLILSLDIGSSSCKAVVFSETGDEMSAGKGHYPLHYSENKSEIEQHPEEIWKGVCAAIKQLNLQRFKVSQIAAISLTSQISSHFLIDSHDHPLTHVITWMDSRAAEEAKQMKASFPPGELLRLLGAEMPVSPSWPIPKLLWMSSHIPDALAAAKYIVQPKEWILWKLTGEWRTDCSSLRGLVHQTTGIPCEPLLQWAGVSRDLIPTVGNPYDIIGSLSAGTAELLGLPAGIPVVLGWNDLNAAVLGTAGMKDTACGFDITGTSEHVGVLYRGESALKMPGMTGTNWIPFLPDRQMAYGVTSSGGQALKWYVEKIDQFAQTSSFNYSTVVAQAETVPARSDGLIFLPYINGERSPWWNPAARGVFFGLHATHNRRHMARAVMEGVGYALRTIQDRLSIRPESMRIAGGASRIHLWNQIKADILGIPLVKTSTIEAGCLGAAILAAYGLGWYDSLTEACAVMIHTGQEFLPQMKARAVYDEGFQQFNELYQALVPVFDKYGRPAGMHEEVDNE